LELVPKVGEITPLGDEKIDSSRREVETSSPVERLLRYIIKRGST